MRLFSEEVLHDLHDLRHARHAADEHNLIDLASLERRIAKGGLAWADRFLDEVVHEAFELGSRKLHGEMFRPARVCRDKGQIDLGLLRARKFDLGFLGRFLQTLQGKLILAEIDAVLPLELAREIIDKPHVEVFTAKERIAIGRFDFEDAVADFEDRDIERTAAKVINRDRFRFFFLSRP